MKLKAARANKAGQRYINIWEISRVLRMLAAA